MSVLGRVFLIPMGYTAALVAAVGVIAAVEWFRAYPPVADDPAMLVMTAVAVFTDAVVMSVAIGRAALLPIAAAIVLAELFAVRSVFYFFAAGLVVAGVVTRLTGPSETPALLIDPATIAAAGLVGGFAYWAVCGQWSGVRRREPIAS